MTKPRIAIPIPTSNDLEYNQRCWPQYAAAIQQAGGDPVEVPLTLLPAEIADLITTCQAILLPGSPADVNPQKYGHERIEATADSDPARENVDELLLQDAHNLYKPILALCFGLQILNVWRGGTLIQDLTVMPVNHAAGGSVAIAHSTMVAPQSLLGSLTTLAEAPLHDEFLRLPVNSSHHQAVGIPGDGLRVVARCTQDGVIEAVEGDRAVHCPMMASPRTSYLAFNGIPNAARRSVRLHEAFSPGLSPRLPLGLLARCTRPWASVRLRFEMFHVEHFAAKNQKALFLTLLAWPRLTTFQMFHVEHLVMLAFSEAPSRNDKIPKIL